MEKIIKYQAKDGIVYDSEEACLKHEKECRERKESLKIFDERFHPIKDIDPIIVRTVMENYVDEESAYNAFWFKAFVGWRDILRNRYANFMYGSPVSLKYSCLEGENLVNGKVYIFIKDLWGEDSCIFDPEALLGKFTKACSELGDFLTKEVEKESEV